MPPTAKEDAITSLPVSDKYVGREGQGEKEGTGGGMMGEEAVRGTGKTGEGKDGMVDDDETSIVDKVTRSMVKASERDWDRLGPNRAVEEGL